METLQYVRLGKQFTKIRQPDGTKIRVEKKAHILINGRTVCKSENGYKRLRVTIVENPSEDQICRNCQRILEQNEPDLSVIMGEKMA